MKYQINCLKLFYEESLDVVKIHLNKTSKRLLNANELFLTNLCK